MIIIDFIGALIGLLFFGHVAHAPGQAVISPVAQSTTQAVAQPTTTPPVGTSNTSPIVQTPAYNPADIEALAKCLTKQGAVMYGAYWCPHCQNQKKEFADAFKFVTYQECDSKGELGDPAACKKAGVQGYPTWKIPGHSVLEGEQPLADLATASKCKLN